MRSLVKIAVAGALLASCGSAFADVAAPSGGNGELVLFVRDLANESRVYARGLGITVDSLLTASQITGDPTKPSNLSPNFADTDTLNFSLPAAGITADANLTTFLQGRTNFVWTVMAGDTLGGANLEGGRRYVTTSQVDFTTTASQIANSDLTGSYGSIDGMFTALNGTLDNPAGSSTHADASSASGWQDGWWGESATSYVSATNWFGVAGPNNNNGLGGAAHLYLLTGSGAPGAAAFARVYKGLDLTLSNDGTLSSASVGGPQVPLPAAVWLLGSALAGFAGISRRRKLEAV